MPPTTVLVLIALIGAGGLAAFVHALFGLDYVLWYGCMVIFGRSILFSGRASCDDGQRVVVSLTTLPSRLPGIFPTLNSLICQDRPPDAVYLNVPEFSVREQRPYEIPTALEKHPRIVVNRTGADAGPLTKLLPTLSAETDGATLIITVDDDTIYHKRMITELVRCHKAHPQAALGLRGWRIPRSGRYHDSRTRFARSLSAPLPVDILTGVAGVLYRRDHFRPDFFCRESLPRESFFVDDICISGYLADRKIPRLIIPFRLREPFCRYFRTARTNPLWRINRDGDNNQVMLAYFFGCPKPGAMPDSPLRRWYDRYAYPRWFPLYNRIFQITNQYFAPPPLSMDKRQSVLRHLLAVLNGYLRGIGVSYWLECGTLLGAIRNGKMIPWDDDADVGMLAADHRRAMAMRHRLPSHVDLVEISWAWPFQKVCPVLNLFKRRTFLRLVHRPTGCFVDIFEFRKAHGRYRMLPWEMFQTWRARVDKALRLHAYASESLFPLQECPFEGGVYPVPRRAADVLTIQYGSDYLVPDRRWDGGKRSWVPAID